MKESKRRQLHYRKATFLHPTGQTLQGLIEQALDKLVQVGSRMQGIEEGAEDVIWRRFVNTHRSSLGMEFGALVLYAPDQNRHIIAIDESADELDVRQIAPPADSSGRKNQFLESLLFYGVKDDHLILLQSVALRARDLELYLNWLFRQAGLIGNDNAVFLNNYVPLATQRRLDRADVKSVRIGTPLVDMAAGIQDFGQTKRTRFRPFGEGMDIVKQLLLDRVKEISLEDLNASTNLEVFVEVTYRRQTDEATQKALNRITAALRHVSDEDVRIELKDGSSVVGTELQIKTYRQIVGYNGLVDPQDVFEQMHAWLMDTLAQGLIDAE